MSEQGAFVPIETGGVRERVRAQDPIVLAGIAGLLSIALAVVAGAVSQMWDFPPTGATAAEIAAYVAEHRSALLVAMVLNTSAVTLWLVFGAGVWQRLRRIAGSDSLAATCFAFGFAGFVTLILAGFVPFFVLTYRAQGVTDPRLLYDAAFGLLAMSGMPTAVALVSYAALVFRAGHLPRWTAMLAAFAAFAHVVLIASFLVPSGFFSLEGAVIIVIPAALFAWIAGTSFALIYGPGRVTVARAGPTSDL